MNLFTVIPAKAGTHLLCDGESPRVRSAYPGYKSRGALRFRLQLLLLLVLLFLPPIAVDQGRSEATRARAAASAEQEQHQDGFQLSLE
ncbi:hypothetical protein [Lysobacter auxotrophicus]|uniref:hypothetical protein n=1 Tax=Lysobacter auxotrophicus TaxID=2992573 RepID=UPI002493A52C|nr:hypothetical protein [Lysobacter auxotrophicus]